MFGYLRLQGGVGDARLMVGHRVLVQSSGQLLHSLLVEAHPILLHAGLHDMLQLCLLDEPVACR